MTSEVVEEATSGNEGVRAVGGPHGRPVFVTESPRGGLGSSAELKDGSLEQSLRGRPVQGEGDTLDVCARLVRVLNSAGGNWAEPVWGERDEDSVIRSVDSEEGVAVQVVRAISDSEYWHTLGTHHERSDTLALDQAATFLRQAVQHKVGRDGVPQRQRGTLWLVIDANRVPALAFREVVDRFEALHGSWLRTLGFAQVWLVGPSPEFIHHLA